MSCCQCFGVGLEDIVSCSWFCLMPIILLLCLDTKTVCIFNGTDKVWQLCRYFGIWANSEDSWQLCNEDIHHSLDPSTNNCICVGLEIYCLGPIVILVVILKITMLVLVLRVWYCVGLITGYCTWAVTSRSAGCCVTRHSLWVVGSFPFNLSDYDLVCCHWYAIESY